MVDQPPFTASVCPVMMEVSGEYVNAMLAVPYRVRPRGFRRHPVVSPKPSWRARAAGETPLGWIIARVSGVVRALA